MSEQKITTKSVGKDVVQATPILLEKTPETVIQFNPTIHTAGVCGNIVKLRKDKKTEWKTLRQSDFKNHALSSMEKIEIPISTAALKKFVQELGAREEISQNGVKYGTREYVTVEKEKVLLIDDANKKDAIEQFLKKGYSSDFLDSLAGREPELANQFSEGRLQMRRRGILEELKQRLAKTFPETSGPDSWQKWILKNYWLFGSNYLAPIDRQKINISGVMPDYLFPTADGFVDVLEIKLPSDDVLVPDENHHGSWKWTPGTNSAIGQVVHYLAEMERQRSELEREIKSKHKKEIALLKPRAFVLIGNSLHWEQMKREGLRNLNHALHSVEVLTYYDLECRGKSFVDSPVAEFSSMLGPDEIPF